MVTHHAESRGCSVYSTSSYKRFTAEFWGGVKKTYLCDLSVILHFSCVCAPDPTNVANRVIVGFISSLLLFPVKKLFPFMFRKINTFRSFTLVRMEQLKKEALKRKALKSRMKRRMEKGKTKYSTWGKSSPLRYARGTLRHTCV